MPNRYRDYRQFAPVNECMIKDYTQYTAEQLKRPWSVEDSIANPNYDYAFASTVVIKGIPPNIEPEEVLGDVMTLNGELPWFNHDVLSISAPRHQ